MIPQNTLLHMPFLFTYDTRNSSDKVKKEQSLKNNTIHMPINITYHRIALSEVLFSNHDQLPQSTYNIYATDYHN
jgi:hypothetical protein